MPDTAADDPSAEPLGPAHRLAVYGTLAPGRSNEAELADVPGQWTRGTVRGHLHARGWGAASGYPAVVLDPEGPEVEVHLLTSAELPRHWSRLDAFEGPGYLRTPVEVAVDGEAVVAQIYELAESER